MAISLNVAFQAEALRLCRQNLVSSAVLRPSTLLVSSGSGKDSQLVPRRDERDCHPKAHQSDDLGGEDLAAGAVVLEGHVVTDYVLDVVEADLLRALGTVEVDRSQSG